MCYVRLAIGYQLSIAVYMEVSKDGYLFEGLIVCGLAICALCSNKYGNEGVFRCEQHSSHLFVGRKQPAKPADVGRKQPMAPA